VKDPLLLVELQWLMLSAVSARLVMGVRAGDGYKANLSDPFVFRLGA
jgi:hypothetical protein